MEPNANKMGSIDCIITGGKLTEVKSTLPLPRTDDPHGEYQTEECGGSKGGALFVVSFGSYEFARKASSSLSALAV